MFNYYSILWLWPIFFFPKHFKSRGKKRKEKKETKKTLLPKNLLKFFKSLGKHYVFTKFAAGDVS